MPRTTVEPKLHAISLPRLSARDKSLLITCGTDTCNISVLVFAISRYPYNRLNSAIHFRAGIDYISILVVTLGLFTISF